MAGGEVVAQLGDEEEDEHDAPAGDFFFSPGDEDDDEDEDEDDEDEEDDEEGEDEDDDWEVIIWPMGLGICMWPNSNGMQVGGFQIALKIAIILLECRFLCH